MVEMATKLIESVLPGGAVEKDRIRFVYLVGAQDAFETQYAVFEVKVEDLEEHKKDAEKYLESEIIKHFVKFNGLAPVLAIGMRKLPDQSPILNLSNVSGGNMYGVDFRYDSFVDPFGDFVNYTPSVKSRASSEKVDPITEAVYPPKPVVTQEERIKKDEPYGKALLEAVYGDDSKQIENQVQGKDGLFLTHGELRSAFVAKKFRCLITQKEKATLSHIIPHNVKSFGRAVSLFRGRNVWVNDDFITVYDLRNVLPLTKELKEEFDRLFYTFIYDVFDDKWSIFCPAAYYGKIKVKCYGYIDELNDNALATLNKRIDDYIKTNKIFKRCLLAHNAAFCQSWRLIGVEYAHKTVNGTCVCVEEMSLDDAINEMTADFKEVLNLTSLFYGAES